MILFFSDKNMELQLSRCYNVFNPRISFEEMRWERKVLILFSSMFSYFEVKEHICYPILYKLTEVVDTRAAKIYQ